MLLEKGRGQVLARISCSGGTRGPAWQKPSKTQIGGKIGTKSSRRLSRGSSEDYRISWLEFVEELSGARFLYTFNDLGVSCAVGRLPLLLSSSTEDAVVVTFLPSGGVRKTGKRKWRSRACVIIPKRVSSKAKKSQSRGAFCCFLWVVV